MTIDELKTLFALVEKLCCEAVRIISGEELLQTVKLASASPSSPATAKSNLVKAPLASAAA
ncbi:hypothetical protein [Caulobacter sp. 17J65-9]|uniref:hypothetical protein n=1 Tax=Caulobacter sp. 17J65-9 TaxID=2709382 RepID=UPI0013C94B34|nr:hypothetical protein [Caulobacter sp. 17J65-9]NEX91160.1 hypothetical protein [Caulobacter sp. 17J65-9]